MDTRLPCEFLAVVIVIFASPCFEGVVAQAYSWSVAVPLSITTCNGNSTLNLDWTYAPTSPVPFLIEWSKQGTSGAFDKIASYDGKFKPSGAYNGSVSRRGSTAGIAIQRPLTAADGGLYRVSVTNSSGISIAADANVTIPVVTESIIALCGSTGADVYTVSCSVGVSTPVILQLKNSTDIIGSGSSVNGLQRTISNAANLTFWCSVTGDGSECITPSTTNVNCTPETPTLSTTTRNTTPDVSTSTPSGSTTPHPKLPDGICTDNKLCYWLILLIPVLIILIGVLVWWRRRKNKGVKSAQANETKMTETNQSSVQQRV